MSRVHRRGVIAGPKAGGATKTYAEFVAHITTLAVQGERGWSAAMSAGAWRTTVGAATGAMTGTVWLTYAFEASALSRAVQHALPSLAEMTSQTGKQVFVRLVADASRVAFSGLTRNGFTSAAFNDGIAHPVILMTELLYWDAALGMAMRMQPSLGLGPTPYTW